MNRRDFIKMGGIAGLALLQPWDVVRRLGVSDLSQIRPRLSEWDLPAEAAYEPTSKTMWDGMLHGNPVDKFSLYKMPYLQQYQRTSVSTAGWAVSSDEPTSQWHDTFATYVTQTHAPSLDRHNWFFFDEEVWPVTTQAERLATATKLANLVTNMKSRMPDWKFGYYVRPMKYDFVNAHAVIGGGSYNAFQANNEDLATTTIYQSADAFFPYGYMPYTRDLTDPQTVSSYETVLRQTILEQRRLIKKYGKNQPIYPFLSWTQSGGGTQVLDFDLWEMSLRVCYQYADGFVLWGGFGVDWNVDKLQPWWLSILANIESGRFWSPAV